MVIIWGSWTADTEGIWTLREDQRIKVRVDRIPPEGVVKAGIEAEFIPGEVVPGEMIEGGKR